MKAGKHSRRTRSPQHFFSELPFGIISAAVLLLCVFALTFGRGTVFRALDRCGLCPHSWENGVCARCGRHCGHGSWVDGICTVCGEACAHSFGSDSVCSLCGTVCAHEWSEGICARCGKTCGHQWADGICALCGMNCPHSFTDGVCGICGLTCGHSWADGTCTLCGAVCSHLSHDSETRICPVCGGICAHCCVNGACSLCGMKMPFVTANLPEEIFTGTAVNTGIAGNTGTADNADHADIADNTGNEPGTLYAMNYTTRNYPYEDRTGEASEPVEKEMLVYLPAGYDPEKQYNVLFLLHGNYGWIYDWLGSMNAFRNRQLSGKELLDGMIGCGFCEPLIVIGLTYYTDTAEDGLIYGESQFNREMVQDILPSVARHLGTYAENSTPEALTAAREHFGVIGLSDGALYTLRLMAAAPEHFSWFGCFSGNNGTKDVAEALNSSGLEIGYFITGAGADDSQRDNVEHEFLYLQQGTDKVRDSENAACIIVENCGHSWSCWYTMLYNALLVFFHDM